MEIEPTGFQPELPELDGVESTTGPKPPSPAAQAMPPLASQTSAKTETVAEITREAQSKISELGLKSGVFKATLARSLDVGVDRPKAGDLASSGVGRALDAGDGEPGRVSSGGQAGAAAGVGGPASGVGREGGLDRDGHAGLKGEFKPGAGKAGGDDLKLQGDKLGGEGDFTMEGDKLGAELEGAKLQGDKLGSSLDGLKKEMGKLGGQEGLKKESDSFSSSKDGFKVKADSFDKSKESFKLDGDGFASSGGFAKEVDKFGTSDFSVGEGDKLGGMGDKAEGMGDKLGGMEDKLGDKPGGMGDKIGEEIEGFGDKFGGFGKDDKFMGGATGSDNKGKDFGDLGKDGSYTDSFGKKDGKGGMGKTGDSGWKKDDGDVGGTGSKDKSDKTDKTDQSDKTDQTDSSDSTKKDKADGADDGGKDKEKKESTGMGGPGGGDPTPWDDQGRGSDPLGLRQQRERDKMPSGAEVGIDHGEGDRGGGSSSDPELSRDARINPGIDGQMDYEVRQEGPSLLWQLQHYGVDPPERGAMAPASGTVVQQNVSGLAGQAAGGQLQADDLLAEGEEPPPGSAG